MQADLNMRRTTIESSSTIWFLDLVNNFFISPAVYHPSGTFINNISRIVRVENRPNCTKLSSCSVWTLRSVTRFSDIPTDSFFAPQWYYRLSGAFTSCASQQEKEKLSDFYRYRSFILDFSEY